MVEFFFPNGKPWEREPVLVINWKGKIYALQATCPHAGLSLEEGFITDDGKITCAWHGSVFDIRTGKRVDGPATEDLKVYKVIENGDEVIITE